MMREQQGVRNRLRRLCRQRTGAVSLAAMLVIMAALGGCDSQEPGELASYQGARPLEIQDVALSYTPELQWVGGRVAAVGVNRGDKAALDSTLVWLQTSEDNSIGSHVTIDGASNDAALVSGFEGVPVDSLESGQQYTFWLAEREVFDAGLDSSAFDGMNFVDTTLVAELVLRGNTRGAAGAGIFGEPLIDEIQVVRDESLLETRYVINWEPSDVVFRRMAIRMGATGGFDNLIWHIVVPDSVEQGLTPPVVVGNAPPHAQVAAEFAGFTNPAVYTVWMVTDEWEGSFGPSHEGYVDFQAFCDNFTDDPANDCE